MRPWLAAAVVAALSVAACGRPGATSVPPSAPPSASPSVSPIPSPIVPPTQALAQWVGFPADKVPRPVVFMGKIYPPSGFSSGPAADAAFCRRLKSGTTLSNAVPNGAYATWAGGVTANYPAISAAASFAAMAASTPETTAVNVCASVPPLVVRGARFGFVNFLTDRGTAQIYAWLFTAKGVNDYLEYPALAVSPLWKGDPIKRSLNAGATVATDGLTLTYRFYGTESGTGPCKSDYKSLAAESKSAVAVALQETPNAVLPGSPPACIPNVVLRSVTVTLASPLGGRVVVDASGAPVSVCPETIPVC